MPKSFASKCNDLLKKLFGFQIVSTQSYPYWQDGLICKHNSSFMKNPSFQSAYQRGIKAAENWTWDWHWRVHIGLWASSHSIQLSGDFVECGTDIGFMTSSILHHLDWNSKNKKFFLFDTWSGLDPDLVLPEEIKLDRLKYTEKYRFTSFDKVKENFKEWQNIFLVRGRVPDSLHAAPITQVAYLHLDMNCAIPECEALKFFWPRLIPGGIVLLDDYAYERYEPQHDYLQKTAKELGTSIASLPTGQGLIIRPPV